MTDSENVTVHVNDEVFSPVKRRRFFSTLCDRDVITRNGGFLFKSSVNETDFFLGIFPAFVEGARTYHYDIHLPFEDDYTFTGFINTDASIGLLVSPSKNTDVTSGTFKERVTWCYRMTAGVFVENGFSHEFLLDAATGQLLEELALFSETPRTVGRLADM